MNLYFDCFSGISGNMILGAFLELGVPAPWLEETLKTNLLSEFNLIITKVSRGGVRATHVEVAAREGASRDYTAICRLIKGACLPERAKSLSLAMFAKLAEAEAKIHGCPPDHVHFHELGGVDALVDIVGVSLCAYHLGVSRITSSPVPLGTGFVNCAHGRLPVPAPATLEILKNIPVYGTETPFELVTPTGAAILAVLAEHFGPMPALRLTRIGHGAGSRDFPHTPNVLRLIAGEPLAASDAVWVLETAIDDMNPEVYGFVMERLFGEGALDVCLIPVFMKKNRPGVQLQVLCPESRKDALMAVILAETTTLGVRYYRVERQILGREVVGLDTPWGPVAAKRVQNPDGGVRVAPEYEACREIARRHRLPLREVYEAVLCAAGRRPASDEIRNPY